METREETPPHHPTHGVHLCDDEIRAILRVCLAGDPANYRFSRLPHGQSFNNRIYMINNIQNTKQSYVLKVNGKFFGPAKIENEVACLQILHRYYPTVPVPRVIAWSTDGCRIILAESEKQEVDSNTINIDIACQSGWILMTRLPGEPIDPSTLAAEHIPSLSLQLAQLISCWRRAVPRSKHCGNLRLRADHADLTAPSWQKQGGSYHLGFDIQGVLDIGLDKADRPIDSLLSYWKVKLSHAIHQLSMEGVYTENRQPLLPLLNRFVNETLPALSLFHDSQEERDGFIFSHTDLSPRNVLISGSPPQISGIVDFEFSGFFPWMQDFTGKSIVSEEDDEEGWPILMHGEILRYLEDAGVVTPLHLRGTRKWREMMGLVELEVYIAP